MPYQRSNKEIQEAAFKKGSSPFASAFMAKSPLKHTYDKPGGPGDIGMSGYGWEDKMHEEDHKNEDNETNDDDNDDDDSDDDK